MKEKELARSADETQETQISLESIQKKYGDTALEAQLGRAQQVLEASFARVAQQRDRLGPVYDRLEAAYDDACAVAARPGLTPTHRQKLLYTIYEAYFAQLAVLSYRQRRAIQADVFIRKMRAAVKKGDTDTLFSVYWRRFALQCMPVLALSFGAEFLLFHLRNQNGPPWALALCLLVFLGGFAVYTVLCLQMEGMRLHGGLQKWLQYRVDPKEHSRPLDILQTGKMMLPLLIALGSALIKQWAG